MSHCLIIPIKLIPQWHLINLYLPLWSLNRAYLFIEIQSCNESLSFLLPAFHSPVEKYTYKILFNPYNVIFYSDVGNRIFILHNYFGDCGHATRNKSTSRFRCHVSVFYSRSYKNARFQKDISIKVSKHSYWWMQR